MLASALLLAVPSAYVAPTWEDAPDAALVDAIARSRDRTAFAELFARYAGRVGAFLARGGMDGPHADELTQEILLEVWHRAERWDPARGGVSTWIFTIARSRRIDAQRRIRPVVTDPDEPHAPSVEQRVDRERGEAALRVALTQLPAEQVTILESAYFAGKSMSDIAAEQGIPLGTVKSRVRLALERLRAALGGGAP